MTTHDPSGRSPERRFSRRRHAEEAFRESEERLRVALEAGGVGFWELDLVDGSTYRSPQHDRIFGYETPLPEWTYDTFLDHVVPEDRTMVDEKFRAEMAAQGEWSLEYRIRRPDGEIRWVWATGRHDLADTGHLLLAGLVEDITDRKQAEIALRESEEKYRALVEKAGEAISIAQDGLFVFVNQSMSELLGEPVEDLKGKPYIDFVWPDDRKLVDANYRRRIAGEEVPDHYEFRIIGAGGKLAWVTLSATVIQWEGKPATLNLLTDITARKHAEEALWESEARQRDVLEHGGVGVAYWDLDGRMLYLNERAVKNLKGSGPDEFLGKFFPELFGEVGGVYLDRIREAAASPESIVYEDCVDLPIGRRWLTSIHTRSLDAAGSAVGVHVYSVDITERKLAEAELLASQQMIEGIINAIPVGVFWKDKDLVFRGCNAVFVRDMGFADPKDIIGKDDYQLPWRALADSYRADDRHVMESGCPRILTEEAPQQTPEGEWVTLLTSKIPLRDARGEITGVLATYLDITERKRAEEALQESEQRLRLALSASGQGLWDLDPRTGEGFASPELARLLGYRPEDFANSSEAWESRVHPDDLQKAREQFGACLRGEVSDHSSEYRVRASSGEWRWVLDQGRVVERDPTGQAMRVIGTTTDITERKNAEQELRLTQFSVDKAADLIYWLDPEGRIILANEASCRRDGYSREEMLSKGIWDLDPNMTSELYREWWRDLKRAGSLTVESVHRTKTGEMYPIEATTNYIELGEREYNCVFSRDITERKRSEEALEQNQQRLKQMFDNMSSAVAVYEAVDGGADFLIKEFNPAATRTTHVAEEDAVGRRVAEVFPGVKDVGLFDVYQRVWRSGVAEHVPISFLGDDQLEIWVENYVFRLPSGELVVMFDDVSARMGAEAALRSSEDRYRQLFELESDAILLMDDDSGRILEANAAASALYGYSRAELLCMNDVDISAEPDKTHQAGIEHPVKIPLRWHRKRDGTVFPTEITGRRFDWNGRSVRIAAIRDVTERQEAELALRDRDEQLRQSQKMEAVGQLAGGIAHDFNNLLTAILGYSELLLAGEDLAEAAARKDIEEIRHAAERAAVLTGQILAFSRRQVLRPQAVSLNTVLDGMEVLLRRTIGEDIDLVISEDPHLHLTEVDPHHFEQVLMNLVLNSRDAMPSGGRLTLETADVELDEKFCRAHLGSSPGSYVMLSVSDTGVGMDEATLEHIFEPFFTTKAAGAGTGLGLATVYGIVKQSNGSIFVTSELGKGTISKIYLPRAAEIVQPEEMAIPPHFVSRGSETVMVVEDEEALRSLIERILSTAGYATLGFGSAGEALEALEQGGYGVDLLLTDVVLPGALQGYDLARAVLAARPDLPVLYVSGYTDDALVHAGQLDPGVNLLEKPFTPEALAASVRTVLDRARGSG